MKESFYHSCGDDQGHFQLESGHHGDLWLELETLCLHLANLQPFAAQLAAKLAAA